MSDYVRERRDNVKRLIAQLEDRGAALWPAISDAAPGRPSAGQSNTSEPSEHVPLLLRAGSARLAVAVAGLAIGVLIVLAVAAVFVRLGSNEQAAASRALLARAAALERNALTPGSMLPCVDGTAGKLIGNACEKTVFASARSAATAVAYMAARIDLLREAEALADQGDTGVLGALASTRRAIVLDRYGIAAHVLSRRDGCTAEHCAFFAAVGDADVLKANLKAETFDQYVSRYAANWGKPAAVAKPAAAAKPAEPAVSAVPPMTPLASAAAPLPAKPRPGEHWDYPSANSIPAVSIMDSEPKLSKTTAKQLDHDTAKAKSEAASKGLVKQTKEVKEKAPAKEAKEVKKKRPEPGAPLQLTR